MYEDIRHEDRESRGPAVEISSVYPHAKYTKPHDDYSLVNAAGPQHKVRKIYNGILPLDSESSYYRLHPIKLLQGGNRICTFFRNCHSRNRINLECLGKVFASTVDVYYASAMVTAVAGGIMFSDCPSACSILVSVLHLRNVLREFL